MDASSWPPWCDYLLAALDDLADLEAQRRLRHADPFHSNPGEIVNTAFDYLLANEPDPLNYGQYLGLAMPLVKIAPEVDRLARDLQVAVEGVDSEVGVDELYWGAEWVKVTEKAAELARALREERVRRLGSHG